MTTNRDTTLNFLSSKLLDEKPEKKRSISPEFITVNPMLVLSSNLQQMLNTAISDYLRSGKLDVENLAYFLHREIDVNLSTIPGSKVKFPEVPLDLDEKENI